MKNMAKQEKSNYRTPFFMWDVWMKIYSYLQNLINNQTFEFDLNQQEAFSLVLN